MVIDNDASCDLDAHLQDSSATAKVRMDSREGITGPELHINYGIQATYEDSLLGGNGESEKSDADMDSGDESTDDDTHADTRRMKTVSCLENLALSFLSQLTASLMPKSSKDSGYSSNSQPDITHPPKRIILELANRRKAKNSDDGETKLRSITFPKKGKAPSARTPAQLLKVANEAHEALVHKCPMTKRDLFYRDVSLFKGQAAVDALIDDLAATFSVNRSDLDIRASSKGLFCGSALSIHLHDGTTVIGHDSEPSLIPLARDIAECEINQDIDWILVVEKDAVFQTLRDASLTNHAALIGPGLLITGKGYPDLATRQLVKTFSDNMPETVRFLALVDADAYGLDIVSVYRYGSISMRHENDSLAAQRLEWIGVSATEVLEMGVNRDALLPITVHDHKKAMALLRSSSDLPSAWKRELMQMLHTRRKAEIEVLHTLPASSDPLDEDVESPGPTCSVTSCSNPLIRYVTCKINNALRS